MTDVAAPATAEAEPAFAAPWEADAFALKAALVEAGRLDAGAFAQLLGEELRNDHRPADDGTAYFVAFVRALERAIAGTVGAGAIAAEQQAWRAAARATPHGEPITLADRSPASTLPNGGSPS